MPDLFPPLLVDWFTRDPLLVLGVIACIGAMVYGAFNLDSQGEVGWFFGDGDRSEGDD